MEIASSENYAGYFVDDLVALDARFHGRLSRGDRSRLLIGAAAGIENGTRGGTLTEEEFVSICRETFRRAMAPGDSGAKDSTA